MRALTRQGRLACTLTLAMLTAAVLVAVFTFGWHSIIEVFALALAAEVAAVGVAYAIAELSWRRRHGTTA